MFKGARIEKYIYMSYEHAQSNIWAIYLFQTLTLTFSVELINVK